MILNSQDAREEGKRLVVDLSTDGASIEIQNAYGPGEYITLNTRQVEILTRYLRDGAAP